MKATDEADDAYRSEMAVGRIIIGPEEAQRDHDALYREVSDSAAGPWRRLASAVNLSDALPVERIVRRLADLPKLITADAYKQHLRRHDQPVARNVKDTVDKLRADIGEIHFVITENAAVLRVPVSVEPLVLDLLRELAPDGIGVFSDFEHELAIVAADLASRGE